MKRSALYAIVSGLLAILLVAGMHANGVRCNDAWMHAATAAQTGGGNALAAAPRRGRWQLLLALYATKSVANVHKSTGQQVCGSWRGPATLTLTAGLSRRRRYSPHRSRKAPCYQYSLLCVIKLLPGCRGHQDRALARLRAIGSHSLTPICTILPDMTGDHCTESRRLQSPSQRSKTLWRRTRKGARGGGHSSLLVAG